MKQQKLLYKRDTFSRMLEYDYEVHAWEWDQKFWLVNNNWCTNLNGNVVVSENNEDRIEMIKKYTPIVEQHEKENRNWLAFINCRKRTCICKSCKKICRCDSCTGKLINCDMVEIDKKIE